MTTGQLLLKAWDWEASIVIGCVFLLFAYLVVTRWRFSRRTIYYGLGVVILLLTLCGPLDVLADNYLFSAHMVEHLILELVVPPLLLIGIPVALIRQALRHRLIARTERILGTPALAWLLGIGTLWIWHLPILYNAALADENIHILQHLSFLVTATIFWWVVLAPFEYRRLSAFPEIFYLFFAAVANGILGALLTFAPVGFYPMYEHPEDPLGALSLIRNGWQLSPQGDQQLGGLLMWVGGGIVFLWAIMAVYSRWFRRAEELQEPEKVTEVAERV